MNETDCYDVVIIGGGVASAACVRELLSKGLKVCLFDKGGYDRDPSNPHDLANGVLGAGSFSDGKYSFFPAGTAVWQLREKSTLKTGLALAIQDINEAVTMTGQTVAALDPAKLLGQLEAVDAPVLAGQTDTDWQFKPYESVYIPLEARRYMMKQTTALFAPIARMEHVVLRVDQNPDGEFYSVVYQENGNFDTFFSLKAKAIIVAAGRFAPYYLALPDSCPRVFRRIEIGVRLVATAKNSAWCTMKGVDPKFIYNTGANTTNGQVQYRSFCCCRDGITAVSSFQGLHTYSGRADCPPTGTSNIGFTARFHDESFMPAYRKAVQWLTARAPAFRTSSVPFGQHKAVLEEQYGPELAGPLIDGIDKFLALFPALAEDPTLQIQSPVIEGCGDYWQIDQDLRIPNHSIWVTGDSTGIFRGLVPAMVSGYYAATQVTDALTERKISSVEGRKFTTATAMQLQSSNPYPALTGKNDVPAMHEIHVFLEPLNPDDATVAKYTKLVTDWTDTHPNLKPMKAPHLALEFRGQADPVRVLQSARYVLSDDMADVIKQCAADADYFRENGFKVLREKIEASVYGIDGIPQTTEQVASHPTKYFEFHIRVHRQDLNDIGMEPLLTEAELKELRVVAAKFGADLKIPVPLSWNLNKAGSQRFLNVRFRHKGAVEALQLVKELNDKINQDARFKVGKVIAEYVWYDTLPQLDRGWIDFDENEQQQS